MLKNKLNILLVLLILPFFVKAQIIKYPNGVVKEVGYEKDKLVSSTRKLYDKRGKLKEQHFFNGSNKGEIKSYFKDTTVASIITVEQSIKDGKYTLTVPAGSEIYGFFKGTDKKKYDIIVKNEFDIDYTISYKRYNVVFNDFVQLYKRRWLKGVEGSKLTYYTRNGMIQSSVMLGDPDKGNLYRSFYDNKQVRAEGYLKKVKSSDHYVGQWVFYYKDGVIKKEEKYYNGERAMTYIKYGTRIDTAIYRHQSGKTKAIVLFPQPEDVNHRTDTLETYYENGQLRSKYNEDSKILIRKAIGRDDVFEFSGSYEEFYEDGGRKVRGYLCKPPRRSVPFIETQQNEHIKCISSPTNNPILFQNSILNKMVKQIGMWYYFDEKGNVIDMKEYRLCGQLFDQRKQLSKKKIEKENKKYKTHKKSYEFQNVIDDNR